MRCKPRRADRVVRPYGGFPDRISQGLPHPFSPHFLFSVCGFSVDKLPLPISPPFLWKSILFPCGQKIQVVRGFMGGFQKSFLYDYYY